MFNFYLLLLLFFHSKVWCETETSWCRDISKARTSGQLQTRDYAFRRLMCYLINHRGLCFAFLSACFLPQRRSQQLPVHGSDQGSTDRHKAQLLYEIQLQGDVCKTRAPIRLRTCDYSFRRLTCYPPQYRSPFTGLPSASFSFFLFNFLRFSISFSLLHRESLDRNKRVVKSLLFIFSSRFKQNDPNHMNGSGMNPAFSTSPEFATGNLTSTWSGNALCCRYPSGKAKSLCNNGNTFLQTRKKK